MWWVPIIAAAITSVVNLLLAFGTYMGRRDTNTSAMATDLKLSDERASMDRRHNDERLERISRELQDLRTTIQDILEQHTDVLIRLAAVERESKLRHEDAREAHDRLENRLDNIYKILRPGQ